MAEKKLTAAEKRAAEEAAAQAETDKKETERKRLIGAGAVLAAVALFAGGYAVGNSSDDGGLMGADIIRSDVAPGGPQVGRADDQRDRGPRGGFGIPEGLELPEGFAFPEGLELPEGFAFPEGFELPEGFDPRGPGGGFGFTLPDDFPGGQGFGFSLDCDGDGECTFQLPEGFEFPGPRSGNGPFGNEPQVDESPVLSPGFLGVAVLEDADGVIVAEVDPGSPADATGIEVDDRFVSVDGTTIVTTEDLVSAIGGAGAGTEVEIVLDRSGEEIISQVVLAERPA